MDPTKVTVYQKPTGTKCPARGVDFEAINYLEEPLSADALKGLLRRAGLRPQDAIRTNETAYRQHVAGENLSDEQLVRIMADHPELGQRPIVVGGNRVVLARPADRLAELGIKGAAAKRLPQSHRTKWYYLIIVISEANLRACIRRNATPSGHTERARRFRTES